uniref:Tryptophan--tRNA ligase, mitochondrial n=1 Tax=Blastobotrys adeninivorans TaxID=409370 RepID=A0A060T057_BLAAD
MKAGRVLRAQTLLDLSKTVVPKDAVVFSAIQPTGVFHLGNYLGSVRSWADIAHKAPDSAKLFYATADLHAITVPKDPAQLRAWRHQAIASIIASGIDPNRCVVYHQSEVPEHTQLNWILGSITGMGYLNRMVQWKSKANMGDSASIDNMGEEALSKLNLGLFAYPVLQAADILLHQATLVPVGEDQSQHLELTRHITNVFNHKFKDSDGKPIFPVPRTLFAPFKKILSLRDPTKKMSKSDPDQNGCIYITDSPETIQAKVRRAVTDSVQGPITYDPENRPGVSNLILSAAGLMNVSPEQLVTDHLSHVTNHATLKSAVADILASELAPVRDEYNRLMEDHSYLESVTKRGADVARQSASETIKKVYHAVGY